MEEFVKVMQRKKGPVWANEPTVEPTAPLQPQTSGLNPPGDTLPQGELSDLEWMKQRMSNAVDTEDRVFEQSDDDEPKPQAAITNKVRSVYLLRLPSFVEPLLRLTRNLMS
jgi:multiple RNA-binding domain-containing protein 1